MKVIGAGGVGAVLDIHGSFSDFYLKIVHRPENRQAIDSFWRAIRATRIWTACIRYRCGFTKIPLALQFWVHKADVPTEFPKDHYNPLSELILCNDNLGKYGKLPEKLAEINPADYYLCDEDFLKKIYEDDQRGDIGKYRLLVTYPVQKGDTSAADYIRQGEGFTEEEIIRAFYQLLTNIDFLYKIGTAHCDIKPDNILFDKKSRSFLLTDFDAFHSSQNQSTAGTEIFLPPEVSRAELKSNFSWLECRVLFDCYALFKSMLCMYHKNNDPTRLPSYSMPEEIRALEKIFTYTPAEISKMLAELKQKYHLADEHLEYTPKIDDNCVYDFDEMGPEIEDLGVPGTFHEQLCFAENDPFDPLLRNSSVHFGDLINLHDLFDIILIPLGKDCSYTYFHTPDDARTHKRPTKFCCYKPKSMENTELTEKEKQQLISYGKKLNEFFEKKRYAPAAFLPKKKHILYVDGQIRIFWGITRCRCCTHVNYETYFRYLITGETTGFTPDDWLGVLYCHPETEQALTPETTWKLWNAFLNAPGKYGSFLKFNPVKQHIKPETISNASPLHWEKICMYTNEFDQYIPESAAYKLILNSSLDLQQHSTIIPRLRTSPPPEGLTPDEYVACFVKLHQYDKKNFLNWFPVKKHKELTVQQWRELLAAEPKFFEYVPEEFWKKLSKKAWFPVLELKPDLIESCPPEIKFAFNKMKRLNKK